MANAHYGDKEDRPFVAGSLRGFRQFYVDRSSTFVSSINGLAIWPGKKSTSPFACPRGSLTIDPNQMFKNHPWCERIIGEATKGWPMFYSLRGVAFATGPINFEHVGGDRYRATLYCAEVSVKDAKFVYVESAYDIRAFAPQSHTIYATVTPTDHTQPTEGCTCGFYAIYDPAEVDTQAGMQDLETNPTFAVKGTGKVILGTKGYRAERQEIEAVYLPEKEFGLLYREDRYSSTALSIWNMSPSAIYNKHDVLGIMRATKEFAYAADIPIYYEWRKFISDFPAENVRDLIGE